MSQVCIVVLDEYDPDISQRSEVFQGYFYLTYSGILSNFSRLSDYVVP